MRKTHGGVSDFLSRLIVFQKKSFTLLQAKPESAATTATTATTTTAAATVTRTCATVMHK